MVLLGRLRTTRWPKYLVLMTGPRQMNSMDFEISDTNHLYKGRELEMARPLSTCMGMIRKRGSPDGGRLMEGCGGDVHLPMKTTWSASQHKRPRSARREESNLYHSCDDCLRP